MEGSDYKPLFFGFLLGCRPEKMSDPTRNGVSGTSPE